MTAAFAYDYLTAKGVPDHVARGIIGNLHVESGGFKPDIVSGSAAGDRGKSKYSAQWKGSRLSNFEAYARQAGKNPADLATQLDFVLEEMDPRSRFADPVAAKNRDAILNAQTVEEATQAFSDFYERPGTPHMSRRMEAAQAMPASAPPSTLADWKMDAFTAPYADMVPARSGRTITPGAGLANLAPNYGTRPAPQPGGFATSPYDLATPDMPKAPGPMGMEFAHRNLTNDITYSRATPRPFEGAVIHHAEPATLDALRGVTNTMRPEGHYRGYHVGIDQQGTVGLLAPFDQRVNHAGVFRPENRTDLGNANSLAITLTDAFNPASPEQIAAAGELISALNRAGYAAPDGSPAFDPATLGYHGKGNTVARGPDEGKAEVQAIYDYLGGKPFGRNTPVPTPRPDIGVPAPAAPPAPPPAPPMMAYREEAYPTPPALSAMFTPPPNNGKTAAPAMPSPPPAAPAMPDTFRTASIAPALPSTMTPPPANSNFAFMPPTMPGGFIPPVPQSHALAPPMAPPVPMAPPPPVPTPAPRMSEWDQVKRGGLLAPGAVQVARNIKSNIRGGDVRPFAGVKDAYSRLGAQMKDKFGGFFGGGFDSLFGGPMPAPSPFSMGTGLGAIQGLLAGAVPGAQAFSASNPGASWSVNPYGFAEYTSQHGFSGRPPDGF